jgi:glycosyltransferase involved in cell wall biosynthesis
VAFRQKDTARPFAFLSAGSQSVRKGTHYLLEAWRMLAPDSRAELWLVGHMDLPERLLAALPGTVRVYPPVSPVRLSELYARAGALVFSALAEGFGMVITEAMAHGLPVITTEHSAGADLIRHGENGFLVPVRDAEQLAQTMAWCLDHQEAACEVGRRAAATASLWQWSDYRAALGAAVRAFLVTGRAPTFQWRPDAIGMKP